MLGIKEREKYRDISWLMPSVDVSDVLARLDSNISHRAGYEIRAYCPDHHLFVGQRQSDADWTVNEDTGETFCFTEGRGSNLLWIICRMYSCHPREAVKFLLGTTADIDAGTLELSRLANKRKRLRYDPEVEREEAAKVKGLSSIRRDIENRYASQRAYDFFIHPPGKGETNIRAETVDHFNVFERTWGMYTDRVIIPFYIRGEIVGFCAVDILGKKEWLSSHPLKEEKEYKKSLYPLNFQSGECLFGFDECEKGCEFLIIVEGAREVMKLWQEGFTNAVAILGAYMSDKHHEMITEIGPQNIVLMFDGDFAGEQITARVAAKLERVYGHRTIKCYLAKDKDPKNLEGDDFRRLLEEGKKS